MNAFDTLKEFFLSRNGRIITAVLVLLLATLWFSKTTDKEQDDITKATPKSEMWTHSSAETSFGQVDENCSFELFVPNKPAPTKPEQPRPQVTQRKEPLMVKRPLPITIPHEEFMVYEPLIKEEREPAKKFSLPELEKAPTLPRLEEGATIHCQLITPATTDHDNAPIIARVTRPLVRDGILLIPKGSKIFGKIQTSKNDRIFFDTQWRISTSVTEQLSIVGHAQQKSDDALDGRLGLSGTIANQAKPKDTGKIILANMVQGIAAFGKDTIRTGAGEYIPGTARNVVINGSSQVIDQLLTKKQKTAIEPNPYVSVPTGREFYLVVYATAEPQHLQKDESDNLDHLLEQLMRKRLEQ